MEKTVKKTEIIRLIYSVLIGIFIVAAGIALICVAADIYYSGRGTGVIFTREIVADKLRAMAIPFIILIGAIAAGAIFPAYETRAKNRSEDAVKLLSKKLKSGGSGEEYRQAVIKDGELLSGRFDLRLGTGVILLCCTAAVLCYVLNTAHFLSENITGEIFAMVQNVLPWIALAFFTLIVATIQNGIIAAQRLKEIKTMIKYGSGEVVAPKTTGFVAAAKRVASSEITLWAIRGAIFAVAVAFIIAGALNGGAHDILVKAINICTECIGLG